MCESFGMQPIWPLPRLGVSQVWAVVLKLWSRPHWYQDLQKYEVKLIEQSHSYSFSFFLLFLRKLNQQDFF